MIQPLLESWVSATPAPIPTHPFPLGSALNPFDGSTAILFDVLMENMPANSVIHLGVGVFQTQGSLTWSPKTGQKIVGCGMYLTTVQLVVGTIGGSVIAQRSPYTATHIVVSDLTVDGNYRSVSLVGPATTVGTVNGVNLHGSYNMIERVRATNLFALTADATTYAESWGLTIAGFPWADAIGNRISDCLVENFHGNFHNNLSALGLLEVISGIVKNNTIIQRSPTDYVFGICPGSHDWIMDGNVLLNCVIGSHGDTRVTITNGVCVNNIFKGCSSAIDWDKSTVSSVVFANNIITLAPFGPGFSIEAFNHSPDSTYTMISWNNLVDGILSMTY